MENIQPVAWWYDNEDEVVFALDGERWPQGEAEKCGFTEQPLYTRAALSERDALKAEVERLRDKMSALSSYVGAGIGGDSTTPEQFDERIRWGIDHLERVAMKRAAAIVETCSQKPSTTWGEVKRAILDAALEPRP